MRIGKSAFSDRRLVCGILVPNSICLGSISGARSR